MYSGNITKNGSYQGGFIAERDLPEFNFHEYANNRNWNSDTYRITVSALHPTSHIHYNSDRAIIEYLYLD